MKHSNDAVLMLLNMTLEEGNSAPSVHLMTGVIDEVASSIDTLYIITRAYSENDCEQLAESKRNYNIRHIMIDVPVAGRSNIAKRYLNDYSYFRKAYNAMLELDRVGSVFVQSCVNPASAIHFSRKAFPKAKIVYNVQDIYSEAALCRGLVTARSPFYKIVAGLEARAYRNSDTVITVSEGMAQTIEDAGCCRDKIAVVHNWSYSDSVIRIDKSENDFMHRYGLDDDSFKVVYAGNIGALQDIETLVEAAALLRSHNGIRLVIVGNGLRAESIRKRADELSLNNTVFFDRQTSDTVEQVYSMADLNVISLIPGMTRAALPSKTAICLSCGSPILLSVDSDSQFAKQMAETGNCITSIPRDPQSMADAILKAYTTGGPRNLEGSQELFSRLFLGAKNKAAYRELILT